MIAGVCLILCFGCGNQSGPSSAAEAATTGSDLTSGITDLKPSTYQLALDKSLESTPIDRLCKESKGYNQNEWEGKNACGWAIEKFRIEQNSKLVERKEGNLVLNLESGSMEIDHPTDAGNPISSYYQFKGYVKGPNAFIILTQKKDSCPQYWLIDRKDGRKTILNGLPVFNAQQDAFVLSQASQQASTCNNDLEYWVLKNGQFVKSWSAKPDQDVYDMVWAKGKTWYGLVKSEGQKVVSSVQINPG